MITSGETELILVHLYTSKKRYIISLAWYFKYKHWFSSDNGTVSTARDCGANGPMFEHRPLFGQNLGTYLNCGIGKNEDCYNKENTYYIETSLQ